MFQRIVVGTDGSPTATTAVKQAAELAARCDGAALHIVSGFQPKRDLRVTGSGSATEEWDISPADRVAAILRDAADLVRRQRIDVTTHHAEGNAARALVSIARKVDADLIVVGNRGMGGLARLFGRSVPNRVANRAPCAVLVLDTT